jgi:S1-C subfamily serine protease
MDYHTPGDSIGNINFDGLVKVTNYIYDLAYTMSSQNTLLTFQEAGPKMPKEGQGKTSLKVTLGIMPDFTGVVKNGLRADIVIEGKPAYKAGMLSGDIITAIDGNSIADVYEYMERLSKLKAGQIITVEVIRDENKEVLIVQL